MGGRSLARVRLVAEATQAGASEVVPAVQSIEFRSLERTGASDDLLPGGRALLRGV
jgi:hypothetical protein